MRIFRYNDELDDRRLRLMEFIQSGENLEITSGAGDNLIKDVIYNRNEMKSVKSENVKDLKDEKCEGGPGCQFVNMGNMIRKDAKETKDGNTCINIIHKYNPSSKTDVHYKWGGTNEMMTCRRL